VRRRDAFPSALDKKWYGEEPEDEAGPLYRHYKDQNYRVITDAAEEDDDGLETFVVYRAQYDIPELGGQPLFVRPRAMFFQSVEWKEGTVLRFVRLD
jgi:hypothetical protein